MGAGFCGGFVAQWFMAALVRHPGFESHSCHAVFRFSHFSQQAEFHLAFAFVTGRFRGISRGGKNIR